ncbi:MAG TPA: alpha/beta fold hydrolase [Defluviitoga sp.]|nr:alpha/beta fold hydrolase [Defluviitoga sp.]HOP25067.1 alpha/beta fold hydrolase [Defluviitoga sp.]HPZ29146.1 alpha/beta fold hydrolase [Defluviitoga sp.]HQD63076.1 alpha/beta fold hydrolase [Defluviitoga sp.]
MRIYNRYFLSNKSLENELPKFYIVHGLGEYSGRYEKFIKTFMDLGFDVYIFDLPGHGYSSGKKGDIGNFYEIYYFLDNYVQDDYILFGHSLGGLISTRFVEITENKPKKLVLSSPALGDISQMKGLLTLLSIFPKLSFSNRIDPYDLSTNRNTCEEYQRDPLVHDKITVESALGMFAEAELALKDINKIDVPTLLLYGTEDKVVNIEEYKKIDNPSIRHVAFQKGKHELFECIYNKNRFIEEIKKFVFSDYYK